jgi:hypothetical protein
MRSLALLLLLLNITFLTWQQSQLPWLPWQPEQFKPTLPVTPPERTDLSKLRLVGESLSEKVAATSSEKEQSSTAAVEKTPVEDKTNVAETKVAKADEPEETKTTLSSDSQQTKMESKTEPEKVDTASKEEKSSVQKDEAKTVDDATEAVQQEIKLTCAEIGPYPQQTAAEKDAKWFQTKQKTVETHVEPREVPVVTQTKVLSDGFWK